MCLSCGCGKPNEKHGDDRNLTLQDVQAASQAAEATPQEVVNNIQQGFEQFGTPEMAGAGNKQSNVGRTTGNNQ